MGRFCACLGKFASCFCFTSKEKSSSDDALLPSGDKLTGSANCNSTADPRSSSRNAPSNAISCITPNENSIVARSVYPETCTKERHLGEEQKVEWTSGARRETTLINWKIQDFLALCELKELLRNETCIFTAGHTLNKHTRWCFNLQRMKNEDNIGLFLKRLPPLSFKDVVTNPKNISQDINNNTDSVAPKSNNNASGNNGTIAVMASGDTVTNTGSNGDLGDTEPVYIHYECMIKRSGHGETWIHKRTCIPNFDIDQRLGFRKLFTMDDMKSADELLKSKVPPLLGEDNTLHLEIKFTLHLKSTERTRSETTLMESFSLDWARRHQAELLRKELKSLLVNGLNADLILIMEADPDEKSFLVHKGVLAARSPVFAAMFQSGMKETGSGIVRIKDVTPKAMKSVLCYVYSGTTDEEINWGNVRQVQDLIYAADKYSLIGLRDFCDKMMFSGVDNDNAMELLYLAQMHSLNVAVREISLFIKMNANEIFSG